MIETVYDYSLSDDKMVEKLINDPVAMINHMIFPKGQGLPPHSTNSNVYMILVRGTLTLQLDEQEPREYTKGQLINIPYDVKMSVGNKHDDVLEFFVIKAPSPAKYKKD